MKQQLFIGLVFALFATSATQAQTAPPPSLGQETKGASAAEPLEAAETGNVTPTQGDAPTTAPMTNTSGGVFGTTKVKESRRENGQVYRIELQHSSGRNQYLEEMDSDGNIESEPSDIEDTPNLPKWRIGSW